MRLVDRKPILSARGFLVHSFWIRMAYAWLLVVMAVPQAALAITSVQGTDGTSGYSGEVLKDATTSKGFCSQTAQGPTVAFPNGTGTLNNCSTNTVSATDIGQTASAAGVIPVADSNGTIDNFVSKPGMLWTSRASAGDVYWYSVAYGNGMFVAVTDGTGGNGVMTSPDGVNWTARTVLAPYSWRAVTYGNGLFVAVGDSGSGNLVMTSPDGINWTSRSSSKDNPWIGVAYGNGVFVAISNDNTSVNLVMTSPDGIHWTTQAAASNNRWAAVTYGNGLFVAVSYTGTGNRVMTSPDGVVWTARTSAADNSWRGITYGNGMFVAVAVTGTGNRVMTSPDGVVWTARTSTDDISWLSVTYGGGLFVAVAAGATTNNGVMTSDDGGTTWTRRVTPNNNSWWGVTYGNGMFVAVGTSGTGNRAMTSGAEESNLLPSTPPDTGSGHQTMLPVWGGYDSTQTASALKDSPLQVGYDGAMPYTLRLTMPMHTYSDPVLELYGDRSGGSVYTILANAYFTAGTRAYHLLQAYTNDPGAMIAKYGPVDADEMLISNLKQGPIDLFTDGTNTSLPPTTPDLRITKGHQVVSRRTDARPGIQMDINGAIAADNLIVAGSGITLTPSLTSATATATATQAVADGTAVLTSTVTNIITSTGTNTGTYYGTRTDTSTATGTVTRNVVTSTKTVTVTVVITTTATNTNTFSEVKILDIGKVTIAAPGAGTLPAPYFAPGGSIVVTGTATATVTASNTATWVYPISKVLTVTMSATGTGVGTGTQTATGTASGTVTAAVTGSTTGTWTRTVSGTVTGYSTTTEAHASIGVNAAPAFFDVGTAGQAQWDVQGNELAKASVAIELPDTSLASAPLRLKRNLDIGYPYIELQGNLYKHTIQGYGGYDGLAVVGYSSGTSPFRPGAGLIGNVDNDGTDNHSTALILQGRKLNDTYLHDSSYLLRVQNYDRQLITVLGNGYMGIGSDPTRRLTVGTSGAFTVDDNGNETAATVALKGSSSGTVTIQSAANAGDWALTLPPNPGTAGQSLQTNGSGVATWGASGTSLPPPVFTVTGSITGTGTVTATMTGSGTGTFTMTGTATGTGTAAGTSTITGTHTFVATLWATASGTGTKTVTTTASGVGTSTVTESHVAIGAPNMAAGHPGLLEVGANHNFVVDDSGHVGINRYQYGTTDPVFPFMVQADEGVLASQNNGPTMAEFGSRKPLYIIGNYPEIGFNAYIGYSQALQTASYFYGAGSNGHYGSALRFDPTAGAMEFDFSRTPGTENQPITSLFSALKFDLQSNTATFNMPLWATQGAHVGGLLNIYDGTNSYPSGILTELNSEMIEFGTNDGSTGRFGGYVQANQGGFLRISARNESLLSVYGRAAGVASADGQLLLSLDTLGDLTANGHLAGSALKLNGASSGQVTLQTLATTGNWTLTLPGYAGTNGQVMTTDGSGNMTWKTLGSSSYSANGVIKVNVSNGLVTGSTGLAGSDVTNALGYTPMNANVTHLIGDVPTSRTINGYSLANNLTLTYTDVGAVPTSRTINGHPLSANFNLTYTDVGAMAAPTLGTGYIPYATGAASLANSNLYYNNAGNLGVNTTTLGSALSIFGGHSYVQLGELSDATAYSAIGFGPVSLSSTNFALAGNATTTILNAISGGTLKLSIGNVPFLSTDTLGNTLWKGNATIIGSMAAAGDVTSGGNMSANGSIIAGGVISASNISATPTPNFIVKADPNGKVDAWTTHGAIFATGPANYIHRTSFGLATLISRATTTGPTTVGYTLVVNATANVIPQGPGSESSPGSCGIYITVDDIQRSSPMFADTYSGSPLRVAVPAVAAVQVGAGQHTVKLILDYTSGPSCSINANDANMTIQLVPL